MKTAAHTAAWCLPVCAIGLALPAVFAANPTDMSSVSTEGSTVATVDNEAVTAEPVATVAVNSEAPLSNPSSESASRRGTQNALTEEIVVTAQKRQENVQDVPISIQAFSGDKLDALGVKSAEQLPKITPGLTFSNQAGYALIFLRGVGNNAFLPSADPVVPIYLDGVAMLAGQGITTTLGRVERVEVLKGPQGTLFGRNSTGGAISIVTPDPGPVFTSDLQGEIASKDTYNALAYANLPMTESFGFTISGFSQEHDPYTRNLVSDTIPTFSRGGRIKTLWQATDDLSFNASAMYVKMSTNVGTNGQLTRVAPDFRLLLPEDPKLDYTYSHNVTAGSVTNMRLFSGGANWALPWMDTKVITSYQRQDSPYQAYDYDGSERPFVSFFSTDLSFKQSSAELQLLSNSDTPLNEYFSWVAGAYYLKASGGYDQLNLEVGAGTQSAGLLSTIPSFGSFVNRLNDLLNGVGIGPIAGLTGPITLVSGGILETDSLSGYAQGTFHLHELLGFTNELNLIVGARINREARNLKDNRLSVINPVGTSGQEVQLLPFSVPETTATQIPFRFGLQWYAFDTTQLYGSFSRGFSAPTYSTVNFFGPPNAVKGSHVLAYELGFKSQLLDGALTLNGAAFWTDVYDGITGFASITSGGVVEFDNYDHARIKGLEFDTTWQPLPNLNPDLVVLASGSYLHARYLSYPNGRGYNPDTGLSFGPDNPVPVAGAARDFSGNHVDRTPEFSYSLGINQSVPIGSDSELAINVSTKYSDGFFFDPQNAPEYASPSFQTLDASLTYTYTPWGLQATLFGSNLTKALYPVSVFVLDTGRFQEPNDPRIIGLRVQWTFDS